MEMSVSCVNSSLLSGDRFLLSITASKQKKKASGKPKTLRSSSSSVKKKIGSKNLKLVQDGDMVLGMGGGASTLTALRPLIDEEDSFPQVLDKIPRDSVVEERFDSLSSFTLDSLEYLDNIKNGNVWASVHDSLYDNDGDKRHGFHDDKYENDKVLGSLKNALHIHERHGSGCNDDGEEFEWVEINAEDDIHVSEEENDGRIVYWEGNSIAMTQEEEIKLLEQTKKELVRLEREKKTTHKQVFSYANGDRNKKMYEEEDEDKEDEDEEDDEDEEALFLEAEAELVKFEAHASKTNNGESTRASNQLKKENYDGEEDEDEDYEEAAEEEDDDHLFGKEDIKMDNNEKNEGKDKVKPLKRAVPAIMRSFDKAKIYAKAGNGGNGVVAFRREKFVPFGGPSGGSGGRGGHVYVEADPSMNSMLAFRRSVHFRAGRGSHGLGKSQDGACGEDCTIKVPLGTVIREAVDDLDGSGEVLLELMRPYQRELLLPGGRGGRGNTAFKTGRNKTPQIAEFGEEGAEMWLELELKLVADVGIIGVPNAGKSTLLSVISAAQPAIAAYPFTTLLPNLGVVPIGLESSMVVADLPGLLEGAHLGVGLGHEFLRHTERCRVLVHIVDGMSQQPEQEYEAVRLELELFNPALSEKPYIVAFNKMDIPEASERWNNFCAYLQEKGVQAICMSAATKMGTELVVRKAFSLLQSLPKVPVEYDTDESRDKNDTLTVGEAIRRQRSAPIEEFEIFGDPQSKEWRVEGIGLERFTQMTNWEYFESLKRFQHVLNISGVNTALRNRGICEGDTVIVGEMEFVWQDTEDLLATDWKRSFRGSRLWPH